MAPTLTPRDWGGVKRAQESSVLSPRAAWGREGSERLCQGCALPCGAKHMAFSCQPRLQFDSDFLGLEPSSLSTDDKLVFQKGGKCLVPQVTL